MVNVGEIKRILDKDLKPKKLGKSFGEINENAMKLFQRLFIEYLNFDLAKDLFDGSVEKISTENWNELSETQNAYVIAEKEDFRILYVVLKKLTRYRERSAISSLKRENWAKKGEYIVIFYADESSVWDMVCPHYTEGRMILRRYILGDGENHRTISSNLSRMDASLAEPLFDRVQDAFKVQVVTKEFYDRYKDYFNKIKSHLTNQKIDISDAKKFAHLLLNRLMFIYFIQKKKWINEDKNFLFNFLKMYQICGESELLYEKWLSTLFFTAMSEPIEKKNITQFEKKINNILNNIPFLNGGLFERGDVDNLKFSLSDDLLINIIENFLEEYNFTITEESAYDLDIAIDPAMLGKIYESLIAEEERGKSGIFYTPRIEVDLMCRISFFEYFLNDKYNCLSKDINNVREDLIKFIFTPIED
ncbi:MAG: N-6 DNA methylase, partial [Candidatus Thorarchaeota archaeon]